MQVVWVIWNHVYMHICVWYLHKHSQIPCLTRSIPSSCPLDSCPILWYSLPQANTLLTGRPPRQWDQESMYNALKLRVTTSRTVYDWLRAEGLPLPSLTTLQRRIEGFQLEPDSTSTTQSKASLVNEEVLKQSRMWSSGLFIPFIMQFKMLVPSNIAPEHSLPSCKTWMGKFHVVGC